MRTQAIPVASLDDLVLFRAEFYDCLSARADALFELTDAVLCTGGPVTTLVELCLAGVHRRGHGALYDGMNAGRVEIARLRRVAGPYCAATRWRWADQASRRCQHWLRPAAETSDERLFCHTTPEGKVRRR